MASGDANAYSKSYTARSISSLYDLKPGEHIQVKGELADSSNLGLELYTHHLLVVSVVSGTRIRVIHKTRERGVVEEEKCYSPEQITVLDYDCAYTGTDAVRRARDRIGEGYSLSSSNCEHFVTEVTTGTPCSLQIQSVTQAITGGLLGLGVAVAAAVGIAYMRSRKSTKDSD